MIKFIDRLNYYLAKRLVIDYQQKNDIKNYIDTRGPLRRAIDTACKKILQCPKKTSCPVCRRAPDCKAANIILKELKKINIKE